MSALPAARWDGVSREFAFRCDLSGRITHADARTARHIGLEAGMSFTAAAAPGMEGKLAAFLAQAARRVVFDVELALVAHGKVMTHSFRGEPRDGEIEVLGCCLPEAFTTSQREVQQAMAEIVALNRQISRQKQELELQKATLERTVRELDESNRGVTALHREIADRTEMMHQSAEVKNRVLAYLSHECRSPLHTILALSRLLLEPPGDPLTPCQHTEIQFIRSAAEQLSAVMDDMLDLAQVEACKAVVHPERVLARDFVASLRGVLRPLVPSGSPVMLSFDEPPESLEVETDLVKLGQIVRNLVSNALKFTERGSVSVSLTADGETLAVRVQDTGIGIAREDFECIFEEFGQVDSPVQRRVKGTGLGLPLSRRLAQLLGGSLEVESEPGAGSAFTVRLPRVHPEVRELKAIERRPLDPERLPILVVEHDRKAIFVYERFLSMIGHQVVPARTVAEAERILRTVKPAAIVLDIMLEGESAWSFLARVKQDPATADVPVLVVTVTNREQKARALGADEFWLKPLDPDMLIRRLKSLREGHRSRVLLIDDDESARYIIESHLRDTPYDLVEADNAADGVRLARESRPHLILLDFLLGDGTAFDVLDELKADPATRRIPVIVVTSHELDTHALQRLEAHAGMVLSKESLSREIAINRIRDALQKSGVVTRAGRP